MESQQFNFERRKVSTFNKQIIRQVHIFLKNKNCNLDIQLLCEMLKIEIKEKTIEQHLEERDKLRDSLSEENVIINKEIKKIETKLHHIYNVAAKGAHIRSRDKWIELAKKKQFLFFRIRKTKTYKKINF